MLHFDVIAANIVLAQVTLITLRLYTSLWRTAHSHYMQAMALGNNLCAINAITVCLIVMYKKSKLFHGAWHTWRICWLKSMQLKIIIEVIIPILNGFKIAFMLERNSHRTACLKITATEFLTLYFIRNIKFDIVLLPSNIKFLW